MQSMIIFGEPLTVATKIAMVNLDFHSIIKTDYHKHMCVLDPSSPAKFCGHKMLQCSGVKDKYYYMVDDKFIILSIADIVDWIETTVESKQCPSCEEKLVKRSDGFYGCNSYIPSRPLYGCITKLNIPQTRKKKRKLNAITPPKNTLPTNHDLPFWSQLQKV